MGLGNQGGCFFKALPCLCPRAAPTLPAAQETGVVLGSLILPSTFPLDNSNPWLCSGFGILFKEAAWFLSP